MINVPHSYVEKFWTATQQHDLWPQAGLLTQWPDTGKFGDSCFDAFMASQIQSRSDYAVSERLARKLGSDLLERIGPAHLVTHSQGGGHGWAIADTKPALVRSIVALEPVGSSSSFTGLLQIEL